MYDGKYQYMNFWITQESIIQKHSNDTLRQHIYNVQYFPNRIRLNWNFAALKRYLWQISIRNK